MTEIHVAAVALCDGQGRVLLGQRPPGGHLPGSWEFPGGKVEPGEGRLDALRRELAEELGIDVIAPRRLISVTHAYPEHRVRLDFYKSYRWWGEPRGREGQALAWVAIEDLWKDLRKDQVDDLGEDREEHLGRWRLPRADLPVITALRLPSRYVISGPDGQSESDFLTTFDRAVDAGARLVQLRDKARDPASYRRLAQAALARAKNSDVEVLLNAEPELAEALGAHGVHLTAARLKDNPSRALARGPWVGASCHSPEELIRAQRTGADFAVLGPVAPTLSHPDTPPLGWETFERWCAGATIPVYALGGLKPADLGKAWSAGAQGVAGIRGFWK